MDIFLSATSETVPEDILGYLGTFFSSVYLIPQIIKIFKTRNVNDISIVTMLMLIIGQIVWIAYGILIGSIPICVANIIQGFFTVIIVSFKVYQLNKKV